MDLRSSSGVVLFFFSFLSLLLHPLLPHNFNGCKSPSFSAISRSFRQAPTYVFCHCDCSEYLEPQHGFMSRWHQLSTRTTDLLSSLQLPEHCDNNRTDRVNIQNFINTYGAFERTPSRDITSCGGGWMWGGGARRVGTKWNGLEYYWRPARRRQMGEGGAVQESTDEGCQAWTHPPPHRRTSYLIKPSSGTTPVPDAIQTLMQTPISFR